MVSNRGDGLTVFVAACSRERMSSKLDRLIVAIKRGETPATRLARDIYKKTVTFNVPVNSMSGTVYNSLYRAHTVSQEAWELLRAKLLYEPMVRARFHRVGKRLQVGRLPYIKGHPKITLGDDVYLGASVTIETGRFVDEPELAIGNHVTIASDVYIMVSKRVTIGDHVSIARGVEISDGDGHHTDLEKRMRDEPLTEDDLAPVTIEDHVWLGRGVRVLKGVTIGRGAIIAAGSVVASDVAPEAMAMGVPARTVRRKS